MYFSPTQAFHHRWCAAIAARDVAALRELLHPDAVEVSAPTSRVLVGADAIAASYAEMLELAGPVTTTVEDFADLGEACVVESVQATASMKSTCYDVFLIASGRARLHVAGAISPRPPASLPPDSATAPGQSFYRRFWAATNAQDAGALANLYADNATLASPGNVVRGGQAITAGIQSVWRSVGPPQLKGLSRFVEGPNVFVVEGVANLGLGGARLDVEFYEVWLLHGDRAVLTVSGLLNPRVAELRQGLQKLADHESQLMQTMLQGMTLRASAPWRW